MSNFYVSIDVIRRLFEMETGCMQWCSARDFVENLIEGKVETKISPKVVGSSNELIEGWVLAIAISVGIWMGGGDGKKWDGSVGFDATGLRKDELLLSKSG